MRENSPGGEGGEEEVKKKPVPMLKDLSKAARYLEHLRYAPPNHCQS